MGDRSILGSADVDEATLTTIVARALTEDPDDVEVLACHASVVPYPLDAITTAGRYWVTTTAATPRGVRTARLFVKHVQSWSRSPYFRFVPEELRHLAESSVPWRTEPLVYQSDLHRRLPPGLTMPVALHAAFLDDRSAAVWLPALDVVQRPWSTSDFADAAYLLGRLAGSAQVAALAHLGDGDDGPRTVRTYAAGRLAAQVEPMLRSGQAWAASPWVAEAFDDDLRTRLLATLDDVPGFVEELESGPQGTAHGDACPNNLLRTVGSTGFTLIDYGFWGRQCLGFDLGQLLVGDVQMGQRAAADLPVTEAACVPAYVEGLRAEGVETDAAAVARAHAVQMMIFTGLSTPLTEPPAPGAEPSALVRDAHERAATARFCLELVRASSG